MTKLTITGDNITVYADDKIIHTSNRSSDFVTNSEALITIDSNDNQPATDVRGMWLPNGLSQNTVYRHGVQLHTYLPLMKFKEEMLASKDGYIRTAGKRIPDYILVADPTGTYDEETKYQIFRNQQSNFMLGAGLFKAYIFGNLYYNKVTFEETKEPKGANPFDDWERIERTPHTPMADTAVFSAGNHSQVYMEPWFTNVPKDTSIRFDKALQQALNRTKREATDYANTLRSLAGRENPITAGR